MARKDLSRLGGQRAGLAQALEHYKIPDEQPIPVSLLLNHRAFRAKLAAAVGQIDQQIAKAQAELDNALTRWRAETGRADGFAALKETEAVQRQAERDKKDQEDVDESARRGAEKN